MWDYDDQLSLHMYIFCSWTVNESLLMSLFWHPEYTSFPLHHLILEFGVSEDRARLRISVALDWVWIILSSRGWGFMVNAVTGRYNTNEQSWDARIYWLCNTSRQWVQSISSLRFKVHLLAGQKWPRLFNTVACENDGCLLRQVWRFKSQKIYWI